MNFFRRVFAILGISKDARVRIQTSDIDVTITGHRGHVQAVFDSVRLTLEEIHRVQLDASDLKGSKIGLNTESLIVLPTDLDENDSPYAIPDHHTVAGQNENPTDPGKDEESAPEQPFTDTEPSGESITSSGEQLLEEVTAVHDELK